MPKWKFRLASDVIVQLQPKPTIMPSQFVAAMGVKPKLQYFEGTAVMSEGVTGEALKRLPKRPCPPWWQIRFELFTFDPGMDWTFRRRSSCWQGGADPYAPTALAQRVVVALRSGYFTAAMPPKLLSHHCMICGKGLTDPASMARWIGPECAGTSTLRVPFLIRCDEAAGDGLDIPAFLRRAS